MRKIYGFIVEPFEDPDEDDEFEEEYETEFYEGFAHEEASHRVTVCAYTCPMCKRKLFEADVSLHGVIFIRCRRCKRYVTVETTPIMRRIGFIDSLTERKEKSHDPGSKALQKERKV